MARILCFGEPLLRFSPDPLALWLKDHQLPVFLGGAELNVASALARWGLPVSYCTTIPDNLLSHQIISDIQSRGINTESIVFSGERMGSYYLSQGSDLKNTSVIYDRKHSAFGNVQTGVFAWEEILHEVNWVHISAISPALGDSVTLVCLELLQAASKQNIIVSIDLNYRASLWKNRNPHNIMAALLPYCDVVMGNIWSAHELLGTPLDPSLLRLNQKSAYLEHAHQTSLKILKRFARVKTVACTFRFNREENGVEYYGTLYANHEWAVSPDFQSDHVTDRIGSGDCFMAGLIYGLLHLQGAEAIVRFAASAGFGKFFEKGDATSQDVNSIQERIQTHV